MTQVARHLHLVCPAHVHVICTLLLNGNPANTNYKWMFLFPSTTSSEVKIFCHKKFMSRDYDYDNSLTITFYFCVICHFFYSYSRLGKVPKSKLLENAEPNQQCQSNETLRQRETTKTQTHSSLHRLSAVHTKQQTDNYQ